MSDVPETLESRIAAIEAVASRLESDRLELEEALELFELGVAQLREVERILSAAERKVERVIAEADGTLSVEPIEGPDA